MPVKEKSKLWLWLGIGLGAAAVMTATLILLLWQRPSLPPQPETTVTTAATVESNPLTPDDFGYVGDYLTCLTRKSVLGIDVSVHQKDIDWQQVKSAGVEFVMLRLAYRGSIEGALEADTLAQAYYQGAKEAGLKVGGYIFTQSISVEEGIQDADFVLDIVKDWQLDLPLVYDWEIIEPHYRNGQLDKRTLTDIMLAFCQRIENAGYKAMIYFNIHQTVNNFYLEELTDYGFWLANYADTLDFPYKVDMWQYTHTGSVPGISGNVDINLYFPEE